MKASIQSPTAAAGFSAPPLFPPKWASAWGTDRRSPFPFADVQLAPAVHVRMRWVPPGKFMMGSPQNELGRFENEDPLHEVTLTQGYWISETPCTQVEWRAVMGTEPSLFKGNDRPVEQVNWNDCVQFCERLSAMVSGLCPRLPSEAEWEYACRAGTQTAFNDGSGCTQPTGKDPALMKLGWFNENGGEETHAVKQLQPNAWGLYDMHGNVYEWCADWYEAYSAEAAVDPVGPASGHGRVIRGGSFFFNARFCRSAFRLSWHPGFRNHYLGFRFVSGPASGGEEKEKAGTKAEPLTEQEEGSDREASEAEPAARGRGTRQSK